jgi:hypothetical protein
VGQTVLPLSVPVRVLGHRPEPTRQKLAFGTTLVEGTRYGVSTHRGKTRGLFQDRSDRSICLCFDAASGLNTVRHMRVHATYWAARVPSPSYHTVVDDALQISHCFDSLFLFSRGQVWLVALSVFAIGENLPRGNLQLSVSLLQGAGAVSVSRRGPPVIVVLGAVTDGGLAGASLWRRESAVIDRPRVYQGGGAMLVCRVVVGEGLALGRVPSDS